MDLNYFLTSFFLIGVHSMQGWAATTRHGVARKWSTKRLKHTENHFGKNLQSISVIQIMAQRKAFCRQIIPGSSSARKAAVDIDIFLTSYNILSRAIYQNNEQTSRKRTWNQLIQFRWTSTKVIPIKKT